MPVHGARHRDPCPHLTGAVTRLHQFVIGHVEQLAEFLLLELLDEPPVELLVDVAYPRLPDEMDNPPAAHNATRFKPG